MLGHRVQRVTADGLGVLRVRTAGKQVRAFGVQAYRDASAGRLGSQLRSWSVCTASVISFLPNIHLIMTV